MLSSKRHNNQNGDDDDCPVPSKQAKIVSSDDRFHMFNLIRSVVSINNC